jgi:4-hydroxy-tetrahydrodipicolinate reductase
MDTISVVVSGVLGKMGQQVLSAITETPDMEPIGAVDKFAGTLECIDLPDGSGQIPISSAVEDVIDGANVVIDFSSPEGAMNAIRCGPSRGVNIVIGTTGIDEIFFSEANSVANKTNTGIVIAPNFAMGAVLMMYLVEKSSRFFDFVDLTEAHHEAKIDSPSGTAIAIANSMIKGKPEGFESTISESETIKGARGAFHEGINIHSARLPGKVAYHEAIFGALGQTLKITHESINRESFMPGVLMATRYVMNRSGLTLGLEKIMELE